MRSGLDLPMGLGNSLAAKLRNAVRSVCRNNPIPAVNQLEAFVNQVLAQRGKKIDPADANVLMASALAIIDAINQGGTCTAGCGE